MKQLSVYKGRTNIIQVSLGYDVSGDTITSQIREEKSRDSILICSWVVSHATDGTDGELVLTLDNSVTTAVEQIVGYMDMKRVTAGEPINVFDDVIEISFKETVTV